MIRMDWKYAVVKKNHEVKEVLVGDLVDWKYSNRTGLSRLVGGALACALELVFEFIVIGNNRFPWGACYLGLISFHLEGYLVTVIYSFICTVRLV